MIKLKTKNNQGLDSNFGKFLVGFFKGFMPTAIFMLIISVIVYVLDQIIVINSQDGMGPLIAGYILMVGYGIIMVYITIDFILGGKFIFTIGFILGVVVGILVGIYGAGLIAVVLTMILSQI